MSFKVAATLAGVNTKGDGTLTLRFGTQEMSNNHKVDIMEMVNTYGWLVFAENEKIEMPDEPAPDERKSPSQRLRNTLFLAHKQAGGKPEDFDRYYRKQMEKLIEQVKERLD